LIEGGFMDNAVDMEAMHNVLGEEKVSPHSLSENSELGALACFKNDVMLALTRWRCKEINRSTHPAHVMHAIGTRSVPATSGHIMQQIPPEHRAAAVTAVAVNFLSVMLAAGTGASKEDRKAYMARIDGVEGGAA
jgi:hypothetical protein